MNFKACFTISYRLIVQINELDFQADEYFMQMNEWILCKQIT